MHFTSLSYKIKCILIFEASWRLNAVLWTVMHEIERLNDQLLSKNFYLLFL